MYSSSSTIVPSNPQNLDPHFLYNLLYNAWLAGQSQAEILRTCALYLGRSEYALAQIMIDRIEVNYQPSLLEIEVFKNELHEKYLSGVSASELAAIAQNTKNIYYKNLLLKAATIVELSEAQAVKKAHQTAPTNAIELANFEELAREATGIALFGDPGSGKSCIAMWLLGLLTQVLGEAEIVVFDTHWEAGKWKNLTVFYEPTLVLEQMKLLLEVELEDRKKRKRRGEKLPLLIWVLEEIGDINLHCQRMAKKTKNESYSNLLGDFLIGLGAQGRKYEFLGLIVNQSGNTGANGMGGMGDYLKAFSEIWLGRVCLKRAKLMGLDSNVIDFLSQQAYPCLLGEKPAIHPTHGKYSVREKKQPPSPEIDYPIAQLTLSIKLLINSSKSDGWVTRFPDHKEGLDHTHGALLEKHQKY